MDNYFSNVNKIISLVIITMTIGFGIVLYGYFEYSKPTVQVENPVFFCGVSTLNSNPEAYTPEQIYGEKLFKSCCITCHSATDEIVVGPGLKGISKRRKLKWIVRWVNNPQKLIINRDRYAVKLYNNFNKAQMTAFLGLKEKDIKAIIAYVDSIN